MDNVRILTEYQEFLRIVKSETIEVPITSATQFQYSFGIQQNLKNALITGLETFTNTQMTLSPLNNPLAVPADFNRAYLQLASAQNKVDINNIPLYSIQSNPGLLRLFDYKAVDWQNCYVNIANNPLAPVPATPSRSFVFTVYYVERQQKDDLMKRIAQWTESVLKMK